jgi:hypothetical protein
LLPSFAPEETIGGWKTLYNAQTAFPQAMEDVLLVHAVVRQAFCAPSTFRQQYGAGLRQTRRGNYACF